MSEELKQVLQTDFWINHRIGDVYKLRNRKGNSELCTIVYYPPEDYNDPAALVEMNEVKNKDFNFDFREVPIRFLTKEPLLRMKL